jgi:hypothetical protein
MDHYAIGMVVPVAPHKSPPKDLAFRRLNLDRMGATARTADRRVAGNARQPGGHTISPCKPLTPRRAGGAPAGAAAGNRRKSVGVSAPTAALSIPGERAAVGLDVRPGTVCSSLTPAGANTASLPAYLAGQGRPQHTVAAGDPDNLAVTVTHPAGASWT